VLEPIGVFRGRGGLGAGAVGQAGSHAGAEEADRTTEPPIDLDSLRSFVADWWCSWDDFLTMGGGFIACSGSSVVGRCVITGRSRRRCAIDIAVEKEYRRRGIASALASSTILTVRAAGDTPYWECMGTNAGSIRLVEKCGLELAFTYSLFSVSLAQSDPG